MIPSLEKKFVYLSTFFSYANHIRCALALGPRLRPGTRTALTNRRLYCKRRLARPVGVCARTLPARANEP
ncbi:hypothetical protein DERF_001271 [Dermatophagoides farinae]|uniref:Uncharacterized protein n=1 Tax=Dermatophagoides farinae TaxID=6954 RepID=A0A922IA65_DERFA|nr:hypothetical protein DERF_001271 [Dermatophagoides farinae]